MEPLFKRMYRYVQNCVLEFYFEFLCRILWCCVLSYIRKCLYLSSTFICCLCIFLLHSSAQISLPFLLLKQSWQLKLQLVLSHYPSYILRGNFSHLMLFCSWICSRIVLCSILLVTFTSSRILYHVTSDTKNSNL